MKVLIAPDKFKGALSAGDAAENVAQGLLDVLPDADIEIVPMADGGEGTAEAICEARGCSWVECKAHDPLLREICEPRGAALFQLRHFLYRCDRVVFLSRLAEHLRLLET